MLCGLQQDGLARSLKELNLTSGQDYTLLTVGIDPNETVELAAGWQTPLVACGWRLAVPHGPRGLHRCPDRRGRFRLPV